MCLIRVQDESGKYRRNLFQGDKKRKKPTLGDTVGDNNCIGMHGQLLK